MPDFETRRPQREPQNYPQPRRRPLVGPIHLSKCRNGVWFCFLLIVGLGLHLDFPFHNIQPQPVPAYNVADETASGVYYCKPEEELGWVASCPTVFTKATDAEELASIIEDLAGEEGMLMAEFNHGQRPEDSSYMATGYCFYSRAYADRPFDGPLRNLTSLLTGKIGDCYIYVLTFALYPRRYDPG